MKVLSIITALTGLVAVCSAAAIAQPPRLGVDLCTERDFEGCTHSVVESNQCIDLGVDLKNKIKSLRPDPGVACGFGDFPCQAPSAQSRLLVIEGALRITHLSTITRLEHLGDVENWENRIQSYACQPSLDNLGPFAISFPVGSLEHSWTIGKLRTAFNPERLSNENHTLAARNTSAVVTATEHQERVVLPGKAFVDLCAQSFFKGPCATIAAPLAACVSLGRPDLPGYISSLRTESDAVCYFYDNDGCEPNGNTFDFTGVLYDFPRMPRIDLVDGSISFFENEIKGLRCIEKPILGDRGTS